MKITQIKLSIDLKGQYCNHWPFAKISVNNQILFDGQVENAVTYDFTIDAIKNNQLVIEHYGKRFGENNVYDCTADQSQDCVLTIKDIRFDDITVIGPETMNQMFFNTVWTQAQRQSMPPDALEHMSKTSCQNGTMNFNSVLLLEFETPILNWLTVTKYKKPVEKTAYFSSHSLRWHYEEDLKLIEEIKKLIQ
jgi:hypothetical protein